MSDLQVVGDAVRYGLTVLMVITVPPAFLYWIIIHPFASRLRRFGPAPTLAVLVPVLFACCLGLFTVRESLVGSDLGWSPALFAVGVVLYAISVRIELRVREHLHFKILAGVPELTSEPGTLLTEGIYGELRHPRYLSVLIGLLAYALMVNYSGLYVLAALSVGGIALIVYLEEGELADRFGPAWLEYRSGVPAVIPEDPRTLLRGSRRGRPGHGP